MDIRHSTDKDFERIMEIYEHARMFMAEHGNPNQWGPTQWPPEQLIHDDILHQTSYVCVHESKIVGTFFFSAGENTEPAYQRIENGKWIGDNAYGVVHRLADDGSVKGIGKFCLDWAYQHCGIIYVMADNSPRPAYEKL